MRATRSSSAPVRGSGNNSASSRYEVLDRVGEGTVFVVYKVRDKSGGRTLALKALRNNFAKNQRFAQGLLDTSASFLDWSHPRIERLEECGAEEGTPFLVTEWLPGGSFEERLRRAPFNRAETITFVRQIAEGLDALHQHGIVHGDLRPRQVLLTAEGNLKLSDAGLYNAFAAAGSTVSDVQNEAIYYLAPERTEGTAPTVEADLYALGVVLYRMLTGRVPFDGPSPLSIVMRHRRDLPMLPAQWNSNCPEDLQEIALRLLEKNPAARYSSAAELLDDLSASTASPNHTAAPPAPSRATAPAANASGAPLEIEPDSKTAAAGLVGAAAGAAAGVAGATALGAAAHGAALGTAGAVATAGGAGVAAAGMAGAAAGGVATRGGRRLPGPNDPVAVDDLSADDSGDTGVARKAPPAPIDEKTARKKHRRREALGFFLAVFWLFVAVGLLGGIVYAAYYFWTQDTPAVKTVPNYLGKSRAEATRMLARDGLKLTVISEVYDRKRPVDTVLKGDPAPGKSVRVGREISVTVSKGDQPIKMPDLTELDLSSARKIIAQGGMKLGQVSQQYHDKVPRGYICAQYPEPGEAFSRADPISLTISRGPQPSENVDQTGDLPPLPESDEDTGDTAPDPDVIGPSVTASTATPPPVTLVSRRVAVQVAIPADGEAQEVRVDVEDNEGQRTVYRRTHAPGDLVDESIKVTREQGSTAIVRIYVNGNLLREQQV